MPDQSRRLGHVTFSSTSSPTSRKVRKGERLLLVVAALFFVSSCESEPTANATPPARFEAVTVKDAISPKELAGFCDLQNVSPVTLPATRETPRTGKGARWINLWATWCKSCVEEIPLIERWRDEHAFEVLYISADEDAETLQAFLKRHPDFPSTASMKDPESVSSWMKQIGLDAGAGLPLHLFLSRDGKLRCARAASIADHHFPLIQKLLE